MLQAAIILSQNGGDAQFLLPQRVTDGEHHVDAFGVAVPGTRRDKKLCDRVKTVERRQTGVKPRRTKATKRSKVLAQALHPLAGLGDHVFQRRIAGIKMDRDVRFHRRLRLDVKSFVNANRHGGFHRHGCLDGDADGLRAQRPQVKRYAARLSNK